MASTAGVAAATPLTIKQHLRFRTSHATDSHFVDQSGKILIGIWELPGFGGQVWPTANPEHSPRGSSLVMSPKPIKFALARAGSTSVQ
jgi:hypothetical protein